MKIVIDISKDIYNKVINKDLNLAEVDIIGDAITNGKVLEPCEQCEQADNVTITQ